MSTKLSEIEAEPLDVTRASRDVWLAKVPHFVSEAWRSPASGSVDVGRLRMVMDPTAEPGTSEAAPQVKTISDQFCRLMWRAIIMFTSFLSCNQQC